MPQLPDLTTGRLWLRPRQESDVPAILRMDPDPEVMRYFDDRQPPDPVEHEKRVRARIRTDFGPGLGYWSVFPREAAAAGLEHAFASLILAEVVAVVHPENLRS
jgi:RimJ/RimL family protein N-acetyltransferase